MIIMPTIIIDFRYLQADPVVGINNTMVMAELSTPLFSASLTTTSAVLLDSMAVNVGSANSTTIPSKRNQPKIINPR